MTVYITPDDPVLLSYKNELVTTISKATLLNASDVELTQVTPLDCLKDDGSKEWFAFFDPSYFLPDTLYKIRWDGVGTDGEDYTETETGLEVKISTDFYNTFMLSMRQSLSDDGETCIYSPQTMLAAVRYARDLINNYPVLTNLPVESLPYNLLLDYSKIYLYRSVATSEMMNSFTYNDIGKSFSFDRGPKLLQLVDNLTRGADSQLALYKKHLRPSFKGMMSRYARRAAGGVRAMMIHRVLFRNYTR